MVKVKFKKLHELASIPKKATELAGGFDVTVTEIIQEDKDFVICKLGFALQPPVNYKITLVPRSSLTKTRWILQNTPGLGDADYTGEYSFRFRAIPELCQLINWGSYQSTELKYPKFPYKVGDRIGQMYLEEVIPTEFIEVEELEETKRGNGGFGSTDK